MRQTRAAKAESRRIIVAEAAKMFRERGVEGASVADVMQAARMTHGGFYKHFASKDDLLAAAIDAAFDTFVAGLSDPTLSDRAAIDAFVAMYLSHAHLQNPGVGCPIVLLASETSRSGGAAAQAMATGIARVTDALAARLPGPKATVATRARVLLATLAGAVVLARAAGDPSRGMAILDACRERLKP